MSKLLTSRASIVVAAALFATATWIGASSEASYAPTTLVLSQEAPEMNKVIAGNTTPQM